jgi:hypothetical protein
MRECWRHMTARAVRRQPKPRGAIADTTSRTVTRRALPIATRHGVYSVIRLLCPSTGDATMPHTIRNGSVDAEIKKCIDACIHCSSVCTTTATYCLQQSGRHAEVEVRSRHRSVERSVQRGPFGGPVRRASQGIPDRCIGISLLQAASNRAILLPRSAKGQRRRGGSQREPAASRPGSPRGRRCSAFW